MADTTLLPLGEIDPRPVVSKLEQAKQAHGIETARHDGAQEPWLAVWMKPARELVEPYCPEPDPDLDTMFAYGCRLIDESGFCATANTELDAVFKLCQQNNLPCVL
jgi:hypothetical protein